MPLGIVYIYLDSGFRNFDFGMKWRKGGQSASGRMRSKCEERLEGMQRTIWNNSKDKSGFLI